VVELGQTDQRVEARRIDLIDEPVLHDDHVVPEFFEDVRHAAGDAGHGPHDFAITRRIFAERRRAAVLDRRHHGRTILRSRFVLLAHPLGDPRLHRHQRKHAHREGIAAGPRGRDHSGREQTQRATNPEHVAPSVGCSRLIRPNSESAGRTGHSVCVESIGGISIRFEGKVRRIGFSPRFRGAA
jgi:hypothetical protein